MVAQLLVCVKHQRDLAAGLEAAKSNFKAVLSILDKDEHSSAGC